MNGVDIMIAKKQIQDLVNRMPDEIDIEDLMYELYVIDKIEAGRRDIRDGKFISHEEAKKRLLKS
jgi:predicted transcriptional regulator